MRVHSHRNGDVYCGGRDVYEADIALNVGVGFGVSEGM